MINVSQQRTLLHRIMDECTRLERNAPRRLNRCSVWGMRTPTHTPTGIWTRWRRSTHTACASMMPCGNPDPTVNR